MIACHPSSCRAVVSHTQHYYMHDDSGLTLCRTSFLVQRLLQCQRAEIAELKAEVAKLRGSSKVATATVAADETAEMEE
jgi:hypothetical protein